MISFTWETFSFYRTTAAEFFGRKRAATNGLMRLQLSRRCTFPSVWLYGSVKRKQFQHETAHKQGLRSILSSFSLSEKGRCWWFHKPRAIYLHYIQEKADISTRTRQLTPKQSTWIKSATGNRTIFWFLGWTVPLNSPTKKQLNTEWARLKRIWGTL